MPYVYQEYPKWIAGPEVIVRNAAEERCIRRRWSRDIGRAKANAVQRSGADALALELAPEILALRARGGSYREIAQALVASIGVSVAAGDAYVYQEYPKWIAGPEVIVRNAIPLPVACAIAKAPKHTRRLSD
jgi:hypothetical protein